jgi:hypothetical protein
LSAKILYPEIDEENLLVWDSGNGSFQITAKIGDTYKIYQGPLGHGTVRVLLSKEIRGGMVLEGHVSGNPVQMDEAPQIVQGIENLLPEIPSWLQDKLNSKKTVVVTTLLLPVFGILGDRFNLRTIFLICVTSIIGLLLPLYIFMNNMNYYGIAIIGILYVIPITCITALLPFLLTDLFPISVRFTCVGLTFNIADAIIGGFTPGIALILIDLTGNQGAFCWLILVCAFISLISYLQIKS